MSTASPNGNSSAARTLTARSVEPQTCNPAPIPESSAQKRPRYEENQATIIDEPQTVVVRERLAAAGAAASTPCEPVSAPPAEKQPVLEGLEAFPDAQAAKKAFLEANTYPSALFQQRETFSALPAFRAQAPETSSSAPPRLGAAPLASAPAAYPHLEEHLDENHMKNQLENSQGPKGGFFRSELFEIPSAVLFAAASQLYHTTTTNPALRVSAAAHFLNLTLQATPGNVASWTDICSWGFFYGFKPEDLRAAVGLVGKEGIILEP
jgi:hypothetical protein